MHYADFAEDEVCLTPDEFMPRPRADRMMMMMLTNVHTECRVAGGDQRI